MTFCVNGRGGMELKGLRVNIGKTKVMRCKVRIGQAEESGKYPCVACAGKVLVWGKRPLP